MTKRKTFLLRLSPELYAALEAWAQQEMRSVNSQIEYILREAVRRRQRSLEIPLPSSVEGASEAKGDISCESASSAEIPSVSASGEPLEESPPSPPPSGSLPPA